MPPYIFYDRRTVNTTEVQFFHESRGKRTNKELDTNMEKDMQFPFDFTIKKIIIIPEPQIVSTDTAKDTGKLDELATFLKTAIIQIQVADGPVRYYPLAPALSAIKVTGSGHYTLATAADGTLLLASISGPWDGQGLEVDITVPRDTDFKFFIKQLSATDVGALQVYLIGERP